MSIFTGLFRSRDKPQNRTAGSRYSFFMGNSTAGKPVTERSAMQMTAVYSCVRILSEAVAGLPLHLYRYKEDGGKEKALDHPLYHLLHDEPNPEMSSFVFRETLMTHLLLWGNAYAQIIRNGKGEVIALYPLMPDRMTVDRDKNGRLYYKYTKSNDDAPTMENGSVILDPSDVLHVPGLGFDGLVGYSAEFLIDGIKICEQKDTSVPYIRKKMELYRCLLDVCYEWGKQEVCRRIVAEIDDGNRKYRSVGVYVEIPEDLRSLLLSDEPNNRGGLPMKN